MGSQKHKHGKNLWVQNVGLVRFALSSRTIGLIIFGCQNKLSHNSARLVRRQKGGTAAAGPANERDGKEGGQAGARSRSASAPAWRAASPSGCAPTGGSARRRWAVRLSPSFVPPIPRPTRTTGPQARRPSKVLGRAGRSVVVRSI
jgi:hypothetical protein